MNTGNVTTEIEDSLIKEIEGYGLFKRVESAGRKEIPQALVYPSCFVYFSADRDSSEGPRPRPELEFGVLVFNRNARSEHAAARDTYGLIDTLRAKLNGSLLGLGFIDPLKVTARRLVHFEGGEIGYEITLNTRLTLPVPGNG